MEAVAADGQNMNEFYQRVISSDEEDCCDSDVADLECLTYLGRNCIMDFSAGGTLSPSESDLTGPKGPYVTGVPVGLLGTLSSSTFASAILVDPGGTLPSSDLAGMLLPAIPVSPVGIWGTLSSSVSDPAGQDGLHVTGGPVGHLGTLSPSTSDLADPGGEGPCPAPPAGSAVLRVPVGLLMSLETLLPGVDVSGRCGSC